MADNVTTDELEQALQDLASEMGLSVKEYVESLGYATVAELQAAEANLQAQITAITELDADNGAESLAEKIAAINAVISDENGAIQNILGKILENKQAILDEVTRATAAEEALQSQITSNANRIASNEAAITSIASKANELKEAQDAVNVDVENRLSGVEGTLETLTGDETVDGSIAKSIADEAARTNVAISTAKTEAIDTAKAYTDEKIEAITGDTAATVAGLDERVTGVEKTLNDTTDEDGNLVKGVVTRLSDVEAKVDANETKRVHELEQAVEELKAYSDARDLKASSMDICGIGNKFRASLGLASRDCAGGASGGDGDGAVI